MTAASLDESQFKLLLSLASMSSKIIDCWPRVRLGSKIFASVSPQDFATKALATHEGFIRGILRWLLQSWTFSLRGRCRFLNTRQHDVPSPFDSLPMETVFQMDLEIVHCCTRPWRVHFSRTIQTYDPGVIHELRIRGYRLIRVQVLY